MKNFRNLGLSGLQFEILKQRLAKANPGLTIEDVFLNTEETTTLCIAPFNIRTARYQEGIYVQFILPNHPEIGEIFTLYDYRDACLHPAKRDNFSGSIAWDDERCAD